MINRTIDIEEARAAYNQFLDDEYPEYQILGTRLKPSRVLATMAPNAYAIGFSTFCAELKQCSITIQRS